MPEEVAEIDSVVAFVDEFVSFNCFQFGWYEGNKLIKCVVGKEVIDADLDWERPINAMPNTRIWKALLLAALLKSGRDSFNIAVGHPHSHKSSFQNLPSGKIKLVIPDGFQSEKTRMIHIEEITPVSECMAHAVAYKNKVDGHCLVISLGFGTVELGFADKDGNIPEKRLESITFGLHQVSNEFRNELRILGHDDPKIRNRSQDHYYDRILSKSVDELAGIIEPSINLIGTGRSYGSQDIESIIDRCLDRYSDKLVKRVVDYLNRMNISDRMQVILTGGGVNYSNLVCAITDAIKPYGYDIAIADKRSAKISAAKGLNGISRYIYPDQSSAIGIDIGNHSIQFVETEQVNKQVALPKNKLAETGESSYVQ